MIQVLQREDKRKVRIQRQLSAVCFKQHLPFENRRKWPKPYLTSKVIYAESGSHCYVEFSQIIKVVRAVLTETVIYNFSLSICNIIQFLAQQQMDMINKVAVCLCCAYPACQVAQFIDIWAACEAYGLSCLECGHCCWTVCSPICHKCTLGQMNDGLPHCTKGIKFCLYGCALECVSPFDGCYNCIKYIMDICGSGVSGFGDILKNTQWLNQKVKAAFELENGSQPLKTLKEYSP